MRNLLKFSLALLLATTAFAQVPTAKQNQYNRFKTAVVNGGFENGTAGWTASGGTFTVSTTAGEFRSGLRGGKFVASAGSQTLTANSNSFPAGNNQVACWIKTTSSDFVFSAYDGTNDLAQKTVPASSVHQRVVLNVANSAASALRPKFTSASAGTIYIDDCDGGEADNIGNGNFATEPIAYTPDYTGFGTVSSSNMTWEKVGPNLVLSGSFVIGTSTATEARVGFPPGLLASSKIGSLQISGSFGLDASGATVHRVVLMEPSVNYITFGLGVGANPEISKAQGSGIAGTGVKLSLIATIPIQGWESQAIFNPSDTFVFGAAKNIGGTFATASATFVDVSDASYNTSRTFYGTSEAPSTANFFGIRVRNLPAGTYEVRVFSPIFHATANQSCYAQISDGTNASGFTSIPINGTAARNAINAVGGIFSYGSPQADLTFRLQLKTSGGTCTTGGFDTGNEQNTIVVERKGFNTNVPILLGSVTSNSPTAQRQEAADVGSTGTVSNETSDWVSGNCADSSSVYTCTLNGGVYSATPQCSANITGSTAGFLTVSPASSTSVVVRTFNTSGAATDLPFTLKCWGSR